MASTNDIEADQAPADTMRGVALVIDWDVDELEAVVARANTLTDAAPSWLTSAPPNITGNSLVADIVAQLEPGAIEQLGKVMLISQGTDQSSNIKSRLSAMEEHPFLQAAASDAGPIATFFLREFVGDTQVMCELNRAPPCGLRQLFT